jgi:DNA repair protein RadA/Sms
MAKYRCRGCGYEADARWKGPCRGCGGFWSVEKKGTDGHVKGKNGIVTAADALSDMANVDYIKTDIDNFDSVLGGGLVKGQIILFGAPMGTGKTRFALQLCQNLVGRQEQPAVFASMEESVRDIVVTCKQVGATSDRIRILGNDHDWNVYDALQICEEIKPFIFVLDSLQAVDGWSTQNTDTILAVMEHCKRTGMCALIMNHMGKDLDFKGGTTVGHAVKTMLTFYQYDPAQDGKLRELFGKNVANRVEDGEFLLTDMRTMISGKNRSGGMGRKAFFYFNKDGRLEPLTVQPKKPRIQFAGFSDGAETE